ncbi:MAG: hypothetical protein IJZ04_06010, partial [Clostridia bacterium]|nr:hypothetical protein [Clostridia bacterium]
LTRRISRQGYALHRRIVVCLRLGTLGSAHALLWAVSLVKNDNQSFLPRYPFMTTSISVHIKLY